MQSTCSRELSFQRAHLHKSSANTSNHALSPDDGISNRLLCTHLRALKFLLLPETMKVFECSIFEFLFLNLFFQEFELISRSGFIREFEFSKNYEQSQILKTNASPLRLCLGAAAPRPSLEKNLKNHLFNFQCFLSVSKTVLFGRNQALKPCSIDEA